MFMMSFMRGLRKKCPKVVHLKQRLRFFEALAYIFIAKFGSLKAAFKWFDTNKQGRPAQSFAVSEESTFWGKGGLGVFC